MKYKVGDTVRIKSIDWYNKNRNSLGRVKGFMPEMYEYLGKEAIIVKCYECSYELNIDHHFWSWDDEMFDETYNENKMESKKVKINLPKNCEVDSVNASVENGFIVVEYIPKKKFVPKKGDVIVTDGLICISDGTILNVGCGVYCAKLREWGISYLPNYESFSEGYKEDIRLATKEEKELLFSEMNKFGIKWNAEEKRLDKIRWIPKVGEIYFYINEDLNVEMVKNGFLKVDRSLFEAGNCFKKREEAQDYADKIKKLLKNR